MDHCAIGEREPEQDTGSPADRNNPMDAFARVFAREYNESDLILGETAPGSSPVLVTKGGACCSKMYIAGAFIEKGGSGGGLYARVADPTGAFELRVERTRHDVAEILSRMDPPMFVTVLGTVVIREDCKDSGHHIAVDEIRAADRRTRDSWIVRTAWMTCDRLEKLVTALEGGVVPENISAAVRHYGMNAAKIADLAEMARGALENVPDTVEDEASGSDPCEIVRGVIRDKGGKDGIHIRDIVSSAVIYGLSEEKVIQAVRVLLQEDECYQPSRDVIKIL